MAPVAPDAPDGAGDARLELGFDIALRLYTKERVCVTTVAIGRRRRWEMPRISPSYRREYRGTGNVE